MEPVTPTANAPADAAARETPASAAGGDNATGGDPELERLGIDPEPAPPIEIAFRIDA